ncbi:STAS domain-containing protein [Actinomadura graeca]|uniref:Anti-sigma factor antagonist n=1 Tax=Actinomadura graeca TaxID=2750812 RepID=A0ABX8QU55_9ACTN|nr:STAS domain-containing protein [Actinomadura graeca]QXJ22276.1 STAS domain-containing protein [Actinomadura graeca]
MTSIDNTPAQPGTSPRRAGPLVVGRDVSADSVLMLAVDVQQDGSTTVLRLSGELDVATADDLRFHIRAAVEAHAPQRLLLDLSQLGFADSSGLSVLVWAHQLMSDRGHQLRLHHPQPQVMRVLHITGLHTRLHITERGADGAGRATGTDRRHSRRRTAPG